MSKWKEMVVDVVSDISLDPQNVRLETPEGVPESDIIQDLFSNEKAMALVEQIVKVGYFTHEVPVVVTRDNQLIVVEGNRRVAALKAIQNPFLVPSHQARIEKVCESLEDRKTLRKIAVKLAPGQDDADQLIAALHTGNQRVAWTPARQAAFFQGQLDGGKTAEQLISQYPTIDVRKFIVRSQILQLFRDAKYKDPTLTEYIQKRKFAVSTLARLYEYKGFQDLAGIVIDETTNTVEIDSDQFDSLAEKVIGDMRAGVINTRVLNKTTSPSYVAYMDELRAHLEEVDDGVGLPDSEGSSGKSEGASNSGSSKDGKANSVRKSPTKRPKKRNYLNVDDLTVPADFPPSVHRIVEELGTINIDRFPNATFDLLRTFLEKMIKSYADSLQIEIVKSDSDAKGFVFLSQCLKWLEQQFKADGKKAYVQVVVGIRSSKILDHVGSKTHLDAINHNHLIVAYPDDVRQAWERIHEVAKGIFKV